MAWETRGNREYYYRKVRQGNKVISIYIGTGYLAELAASLDQIEREEQEANRQAFCDEVESDREIEEKLSQFEDYVRALTRMTFLLADYHPHKNQWRKRSGRNR